MAAGDSLEQKFTFNVISRKTFSFLRDRNITELLMKWSMLGRITAQAFTFDQPFHPYKSHEFVSDFLKDPCVLSNLKVVGPTGLWENIGRNVTNLTVEIVPCTKISLDLFDPLYSCGIVRPTGHIIQCSLEHYADFDELRKMLKIEDSENYEIISREDRQEFLFRLFKHLCLGGELCQYEDTVTCYIETTRSIYKDMLRVHKDPETKEIKIVSTVLKVTAYNDSGLCYPSATDDDQSFAYLIVDSFKRNVNVLYHSYGIGVLTETDSDMSHTELVQ